MKTDEKNVIVKDVFTQSEINSIYKSMENNSGGAFIKIFSQANTYIKLDDSIVEKVTNKAREISGNDNLVLTEYCHARYANVTSNCGKYHYRPALFPHHDETFKEPRFTFDYQLSGNTDWAIIVEPDQEFVLENNQAVTFSGTHQIHWRQPKEFSDDQYIEMLFFHFTDPNITTVDNETKALITAKAKKYSAEFFNNGGFVNDAI
jgi:hypothetical protein